MQKVTCEIRLNGLAMNTVMKTGVTVPEIVVLREIHGADAVFNIAAEVGAQTATSNIAEKERLISLYGQKEHGRERIERLFPGYDPRMPLTLAAIGINLAADEEAQADADAAAAIRHAARVAARGGARPLDLKALAMAAPAVKASAPPAPAAPEPDDAVAGMQPPAIEKDDLGVVEPADPVNEPDPVLDADGVDYSGMPAAPVGGIPGAPVKTIKDTGFRVGPRVNTRAKATVGADDGM